MASRSKQANARKNILKPNVDADESRRKREEQSVEIRKNKREEGFAKKRSMLGGAPAGAPEARLDPTVVQKVCLSL